MCSFVCDDVTKIVFILWTNLTRVINAGVLFICWSKSIPCHSYGYNIMTCSLGSNLDQSVFHQSVIRETVFHGNGGNLLIFLLLVCHVVVVVLLLIRLLIVMVLVLGSWTLTWTALQLAQRCRGSISKCLSWSVQCCWDELMDKQMWQTARQRQTQQPQVGVVLVVVVVVE